MNELEELLLELVDLLGHEERVDEGEVRIGQVAVIPDFLSHQKGAKDKGTPIGRLQRHLCEGYKSVYIHQTNNAALRAKKSQKTTQ